MKMTSEAWKWSAIVLILILGVSEARAAITWEHEYAADVLPNDASLGPEAWTVGGTFSNSTPSISGGILTVDTGTNIFQNGFVLQTGSWNGDTTTGSTVEARLRMISGGTLRFQVGKTNWFHDMLISTTRVARSESGSDTDASGGTGVDLDMTQFHTFRFVMSAGSASGARAVDIYIDDSTTAAFSLLGVNSSANRLNFADGASGGLNGVLEVDFIRWTNSEATAPVPEPASLALIGGGAVCLLMARRSGFRVRMV